MPISSELLEILACPMCKKDIEYKQADNFLNCKKCDIRYYAQSKKNNSCLKCGNSLDKIKGEVLICIACKRWYPIIDDIPHMLPDELRDDLD
jgi:uncharacterized protein YbaR (Trm112 family)|tara:strand:+ start:5798 stop:6073 length:276 start_codon:yes stop_codon:yes gene_type:complete